MLVSWVVITTHVILFTPSHTQRSSLNQACYDYSNESKTYHLPNTCCRLHIYTKEDVLACVHTATDNWTLPKWFLGKEVNKKNPSGKSQGMEEKDHFHSPNEYLLHFHQPKIKRSPRAPHPEAIYKFSQDSSNTSSLSKGWLWAIVGDSRMRQFFSALVTLLNSPRLKYRKTSTGGKWRSVHELTENLRIGKLHEDIEVYHMDVPLRIVFHWDPLLLHLPKLMHQWTDNEQQKPTLLILGSGLHWMRTTLHTYRSAGPQAALDKFKLHMDTLLPQLVSFAKSTYTIIQLQDHIQESHIFKKYQGAYSNNNIDLYNNFISSSLIGSSVAVWDSNIPFSQAYHAHCLTKYRKSFDMLWDCDNPLHTGFVMVEKYANMFLNDICNFYIDLDSTYC
ncbi:hypothetical protein OTU49_008342 [Cherax quadricarinatus]|uniref:Uncharacterized protein n=1 Tax=Cherax quadricarinatus TaxID=27406 RepID=A0AAW0WCJ6_CHEQU